MVIMQVYQAISRSLLLVAAALFLTGCNPATKGWSSSGGNSVSSARLVAAKRNCGYGRARQRAIRLLDARGDRQKNKQRAVRLLDTAEQCMHRQGVHYKGRSYSIGRWKQR